MIDIKSYLPRDFAHLIEVLNNAAAYNQCVKKTIEYGNKQGAVIWATEKSLDAANSSDIKVAQLDATFKCLPKKITTGLAQLLIFYVIKDGKVIPVAHAALTNKTESLYTEVLEWIRNRCPLLRPTKVISDFEKGLMNAAEAVFGVPPQGCDFHYCQALLRTARKKKLIPALKHNKKFAVWFHRLMSINFLPSHMIEPAFRELAQEPLQLSASTRKQKNSLLKYWEQQWLKNIGVHKLSVFRSQWRTNNNCESYNAQMPRKVGCRPGFWPFVRNLNQLLKTNDLNIARLENNVKTYRTKACDKKKEELIETLWNQISGPNPTMSIQHFLSRVANLKSPKNAIQSDNESDSEESDHDGEVDSEAETNEDIEPSQPASQVQMKCPFCNEVPQEWRIFQCGHPVCSTCAEVLNSRRRPIDRVCHAQGCKKPIQAVIPFFPGGMV